MYDGGADSNDDDGVDDVGWVDTNGVDDANQGDSDSKFNWGDDIDDGGDGDNKDIGYYDDGAVDSNIGIDDNCDDNGDGTSKFDYSEYPAGDDSNADGGLSGVVGDINHNSRDGDVSDGGNNGGADGHKHDDDDNGGYLDSVKNYFKNKQIGLENFSNFT